MPFQVECNHSQVHYATYNSKSELSLEHGDVMTMPELKIAKLVVWPFGPGNHIDYDEVSSFIYDNHADDD